jgi:transcriptional regulator with GAF, ATPase, and Fis domain
MSDKKITLPATPPMAPPESDRGMREMKLLYDISRILDQSLDLREVVSPVLEQLANSMDMNYGTLTLLNRKTGDILIEAAHGLSPQQARRGRYKLGEGVTGNVVLTGRAARSSPQERIHRCSWTAPSAARQCGRTSPSCACPSRAARRWSARSAPTGPTIPTWTCRRTPACSRSSPR